MVISSENWMEAAETSSRDTKYVNASDESETEKVYCLSRVKFFGRLPLEVLCL